MSVDQTETPNQFVIRITVLGKRGKPWIKSPLSQLSNYQIKEEKEKEEILLSIVKFVIN